ncbi:MAG: pentapeptide repeat-containing protein [Alphaproteobacteria bacterium]
MNQDETIALFEQGKEAWNVWANNMLAEKKQLEAEGRWEKERYNLEENSWHIKSLINLNFDEIPDDSRIFSRTNFIGYIFPNLIYFSGTIPININFVEANFFGGASFNCQFQGGANFHNAIFHDVTVFGNSIFKDDEDEYKNQTVSFWNTEFKQHVSFHKVQFERETYFDEAMFRGEVNFSRTVFQRDCDFQNANFKGNARFNDTRFQQNVSFRGIKAEKIFYLERAQFRNIPDFRQASFQGTPDLDQLVITPPAVSDPSLPSKYRALRRMAEQGKNHVLEQQMLAGEIKAERQLGCLKPTDWLISYLYQGLSNFGLSITQPILLWLANIIFFAIAYIQVAIKNNRCDIVDTAWQLSLKRSFILPNINVDKEKMNNMLQCLGYDKTNSIAGMFFAEGVLQIGLSALFIFMFFHALRLRFRVG